MVASRIGVRARTGFGAPPSFWAALATGFGLVVCQAVALRETLVLMAGFEPGVGAALAAWLLWTAAGGWIGAGIRPGRGSGAGRAAWTLGALSVLAPVSVLGLRLSRPLWGVPAGAMPSPFAMLGMCFISLAPLCLASGLAFASLWARAARKEKGGMPVYVGEALGAALGGPAFTFAMLPALDALGCLALAGIALAGAGAACALAEDRRRGIVLVWACACLAANIGLLAASKAVTGASLALAWGREPVAVLDTRVQNLVLLKDAGQSTLFGSGGWLMTEPDQEGAELGTHPALLQMDAVRNVLLLGGSPFGPVREVLRHPDVQKAVWVEPDPGVSRIMSDFAGMVPDPRAEAVYEDPAAFLAKTPGIHDVILLNAGDPWSLSANRLYTEEFFSRVESALKPGGIFSFALSFSPDAPGPGQVAYLKTMRDTLARVFPEVAVYPGARARFVATDEAGSLARDWRVLEDRALAKGLDLDYVRGEYLFDSMSPMRLAWMASLLKGEGPGRTNTALDPAGFFRAYCLQAGRTAPELKPLFEFMAGVRGRSALAWAGGLALAAALAVFFGSGRGAVKVSAFLCGGAGMAMATALLLGFQVAVGSLYGMLALVTAAYMSGLAAGGAWAAARGQSPGDARALCVAHALMALAAPALWPAVGLAVDAGPKISQGAATAGFAACALALGCLGGAHFGLATRVLAELGEQPESVGAGLYAWDMLGAAIFSVATGMLLLPAFGFATTLGCTALVAASALPSLCALSGR